MTSYSVTARVNGAVTGSQTGTKAPPTPVSTVVNWLNTLQDWSVTLQSSVIRANLCSVENNIGGACGAVSTKGVTLQIVTFLDAHGDFYRTNLPANTPENVIIADNVITNWARQCVFLATTSNLSDFVILNSAFHGKVVPGWTFLSQWGRVGAKSHIAMTHNSFTQALWIRPSEGMNADAYCLVADNA